MPRPPQPAHPDATVTLKTTIPGHLKNRVLQAAQNDGQSLNEWLTTAILTQLNHSVPAPAPHAPLPEPQDFLREVLTGTPVIGPCGQKWDLCGAHDDRVETPAGHSWCGVCGIRCS